MLVRADFSLPAAVAAEEYEWVASPQGGVERVMLDRVGTEEARATSLVRYASGSRFPRHPHPGGEEILVLSGTFSDETGDYPAGWYMRNPDGSSHQPFSAKGALIFVKQRQMAEHDKQPIRIDTREPAGWRRDGDRDVRPLFSSTREQVSLERLLPGAALRFPPAGGAEVLVLDGALKIDRVVHGPGSWIRLPSGCRPYSSACNDGATVYMKTGHLAGAGAGD